MPRAGTAARRAARRDLASALGRYHQSRAALDAARAIRRERPGDTDAASAENMAAGALEHDAHAVSKAAATLLLETADPRIADDAVDAFRAALGGPLPQQPFPGPKPRY